MIIIIIIVIIIIIIVTVDRFLSFSLLLFFFYLLLFIVVNSYPDSLMLVLNICIQKLEVNCNIVPFIYQSCDTIWSILSLSYHIMSSRVWLHLIVSQRYQTIVTIVP